MSKARSMFGHIKRLGEDRYRVFWEGEATPEGKRSRHSKVIRGTRNDAEIFLAKQRIGGAPVPRTWAHFWKHTVEPSFEGLAENTKHDYKRVWKKQLEPRLGDVQVSDTTQATCQQVLSAITAPVVQRHAFRLLKKICNMAVMEGLLNMCPVTRSIKLRPHKKREKHYLDAGDLPDFLEKIKPLKYFKLILLEMGGGLSHEEACAMCGSKINQMESDGRLYALVTVDSALVSVEGKKILKEPKNGFREREVVIGEPFSTLLLDGLQDGPLCEGRLKWNGVRELDVRHFTSPVTITHNWRNWCERNGVDYIRFGDMRSIYATWHGEAGSPDSLVSMSMGHSDGTTRGRNYQMNTRRGMVLIADFLTDMLQNVARKKKESAA